MGAQQVTPNAVSRYLTLTLTPNLTDHSRIPNLTHVCVVVANSFAVDAVARYFSWTAHDYVSSSECRLIGKARPFTLSGRQRADVVLAGGAGGMTGLVARAGGFFCRKYVSICGIRFTAGENIAGCVKSGWRSNRCGSVFTVVTGGVSRYGIVDVFFGCGDDDEEGYACVRWFHRPTYPYPCRSTVLMVEIGNRFGFGEGLPSVISIRDIDPTRVLLEMCEDRKMFVMRLEGFDTVQQ